MGERRTDWLDGAHRIPSELGPEAAARFEQELLGFQRRRAILYCVGALLLVAVALVLDVASLSATDWTSPESIVDFFAPIYDAGLLVVYGAFLLAFLATRGPRRRVIRLLVWLLIVVGVGTILSATAIWTHASTQATDSHPAIPVIIAGGTSIVMVFLSHFLASLFVALSPREALLPLVPMTVAFVAGILLLVPGPFVWKGVAIACWPLAGGPGLLWSAWRYARFVEDFRMRTVTGRYREIREDLEDARRVHEALLPEPLDEGPVRFAYAYEPMREIGGDYLFAHRRGDGAVLLVLVDVAGHGVASALAANRIHGELERWIEERPEIGAGEVLSALNRFVHRRLAAQTIFASAIALLIGPEGEVEYANAGHPPLLLRRSDGAIRAHGSTATLLGVLEPIAFEPDAMRLELPVGACAVLYTDGVTEARDASGALFGDERTERGVRDAGAVEAVPQRLLEAIARHRAGESTDDALVVAAWRSA